MPTQDNNLITTGGDAGGPAPTAAYYHPAPQTARPNPTKSRGDKASRTAPNLRA